MGAKGPFITAPDPVKPKPAVTSDENVGTVIKRKKEKRKTKAQLKQEEKKKQGGGFFGFFGGKQKGEHEAAKSAVTAMDSGAIDVDLGNRAEYRGMLTRALRTAAFVTVGATPPFIPVEGEDGEPVVEVDPEDGRNVGGYVYARSSKLIRDDASSTSNVVEFNVVAHLTVGEHLVLVGNVAELGGWKVDVGRRMTWSEGDVWKTSISIPNAEASVAAPAVGSSSAQKGMLPQAAFHAAVYPDAGESASPMRVLHGPLWMARIVSTQPRTASLQTVAASEHILQYGITPGYPTPTSERSRSSMATSVASLRWMA